MDTIQTTAKRRNRWLIGALLALPYLGLCVPQIYARATPTLLGFPFFYWYQCAWVVITSGLLGIVYHLTKSR
jgi:uncharacterized membrane protein